MPDDPRIRASDEDRDRTAALLREHHAVGRLTPAEFGERLDRAYAATTVGELDELLADLPGIDLYQLPHASLPRYQDAAGRPRPAEPPGPPGFTNSAPIRRSGERAGTRSTASGVVGPPGSSWSRGTCTTAHWAPSPQVRQPISPTPGAGPVVPGGRFSPAWLSAWGSWAALTLVTFLVWLGTGAGFPWFLLVAGPIGIVLLARWLGGASRHG